MSACYTIFTVTKRQIITILIIAGFVVYSNSLLNGFVWDDEEQIVNNTLVHSLNNWPKFFFGGAFHSGGSGSLLGIYYKPLMTLSFSFLYSLFGPQPFFFHLLALLIHITNSVLVFFLFEYLGLPAFILSLIFLVHPLYSEVVLYASNMQDALYFFFGLSAFLLALKPQLNNRRGILISLLLLASMLSKETGILFAVLTGIYLLLFQKRKTAAFSLWALFSIGTYLFMRFALANIPFNKYEIAPIARISFGERLTNIPKIIVYYLQTLLFPHNLAPNQHWIITSINFKDFYLPLIISVLFLGLIFFPAFWLRQRKDKNFRLYLFFFIWFLFSLAIHLQIFPLDVTVSGRWFYLPMVGLLGMLGVGFHFKRMFVIAVLIAAALLSLRTIDRTFDWRNGLSLYSRDIKVSKDNFNLENNLGVELFRIGNYEEAERRFENSVKLAPHWWTNWNNLGAIEEHQGELDKAEESYKKAVDNGGYYLAYENLASLYLFKQKDIQKAREFSETSLKVLPYNPKLWFILALAEYQLGNRQEALSAARTAYQLNPDKNTFYVYSRLQQNQKLDLNF